MSEGEGLDVSEAFGNRAGFMAKAIQEGLSANETLRLMREGGAGMARQAGLRLYGQVNASLARRGEQIAYPTNALPRGDMMQPWAMGRGGQFATQVEIQVRDRRSGIVSAVQYTHVTDEPHTGDEAIQAGMDLYGDTETQNRYAQSVEGGVVINRFETVPYGE